MTFKEFIYELDKGVIHNKETVDLLICTIDSIQQNYKDDGLDQSPDYEDMDVIYNDLLDIKKNNIYPMELSLYTSANEIYKTIIVEHIEDSWKGYEDSLTDFFGLHFSHLTKDEIEEIKSALEDNASDMTVYDLFDRVSNRHLV